MTGRSGHVAAWRPRWGLGVTARSSKALAHSSFGCLRDQLAAQRPGKDGGFQPVEQGAGSGGFGFESASGSEAAKCMANSRVPPEAVAALQRPAETGSSDGL
jgi:hypothetical protein